MFPRYYLPSAPGLGTQTYIRCYQYRQSLNHIQKHFILLALRKRGDLGGCRLSSLYSKVNRAVEARALGWEHKVREGIGLSKSRKGRKICRDLGFWSPLKKIRGSKPVWPALT